MQQQPNQDNAAGIKSMLLRIARLDESGRLKPETKGPQDYLKPKNPRKRAGK